MNKEQGNPSSP